MVLKGTRCKDVEAREKATGFHVAAQDLIRRCIAERAPNDADRVTDFVSTTMAGLSASARHGLLATAKLSSLALDHALSSR